MAIEWYVSDAAPVHSSVIVRRAEKVAAFLGCEEFDFGKSAEEAEGRAGLEVNSELGWELAVDGRGDLARVEIFAQLMESGGALDAPGVSNFASVPAFGTQISTVLGFITALAWSSVACGTLSGTGLKKQRASEETDSFIASFAAPKG